MIKLTPRQAEILGFIKRCLEDNGFPPTRAEIAQELGFKSPNAAEEHLKALARKGAIEMTPGASRGIRIPASKHAPMKAACRSLAALQPAHRFWLSNISKSPATSTRPSSTLAPTTCCAFTA